MLHLEILNYFVSFLCESVAPFCIVFLAHIKEEEEEEELRVVLAWRPLSAWS